MNKTINIEMAQRGDWEAVWAVTKAAYAEYADRSDKAFWSVYEKSIERTLLTDETVTRIVARCDGMIQGAVLYCPPYEKLMGDALVINPFPEMRLLAVPPEHRNTGIAHQLIRFCEEKARTAGSPTITLHTTVLMETAKQMYERRGYSRYEEIDFSPVPGFVVWGYRKDSDREVRIA